MTNLSTFRDVLLVSRWLFRWLTAGLCALWCISALSAKEQNREISQYVREHWGVERGLPGGPVYAIGQTADGYLWIGTEKGLARFDGLSFRLFQYTDAKSTPMGTVLGLAADAEGNLWIRLEGARLLRYRDGVFEDFSSKLERHEVAVTAMARGRDGNALFATLVNGTLRYRSGQFERLAQAPSLSNFLPISMAETGDGTIWMGTRDAGLYKLARGQFVLERKILRDRKINCLLADKERLWIGTDNGLARWDGSNRVTMDFPPPLRHAQILSLVSDRASNLWIGSAQGLFRIDASGAFARDQAEEVPGSSVISAFVDREGNLWTGGTKGLDQLRESAFTSFSQTEGLPSDSAGPIYADSRGQIWFAPPGGGLYRLGDGNLEEVRDAALSTDIIYSITGGKDGVWVGRQRGGLTHIPNKEGAFAARTYTTLDGLAQNSVYAVYESRDGIVWAGTLSSGVSRLREGRFSTYTTADGLISNTVTSILEGSTGMWLGTPRGVTALVSGRASNYGTAEGLPAGEVNCLLEDSGGVLWIGTAKGLATIQSGHVWVPGNVPESLHDAVMGIAEDWSGSLWLSTANHIVRVNRNGLLRGNISDSEFREFGKADGLRGVEGVKRTLSVVPDTLGRIWFSTNRGLSFVAPSSEFGSSVPAIAKIEQISADGATLALQELARVPTPHHRVTLSYAGVSLSVPERVRFKYKLEGFDQKWSEPTSSREATYTNLDSGTYRFQVVASNSEGAWNGPESEVRLEIEPLLWQRWWFRLMALTAIALAALLFHRIHVLQLSRQMNLRFEERLGERTRIAQELHDTLLQGLISASMQLHVVADQIPRDSAAKPKLGHVLELMRRVIEEGRNAVGGLRAHQNGSLDLGEAFSQVRQEFAGQGEAEFHVIVEGTPRPLHPLIRDEIYKIGREALTNVFRHSRASNIEVELEYATDGLRVLVRDSGKGFDPKVLHSGPDGHWGLTGMRERAKRIGARLRVLTRPAAGTEVELTVPGHISYVPAASTGASKWLSKVVPGRKPTIERPASKQGQ